MKKFLQFFVIAAAINTAWGATCAELNPEMTNADWENGVVYGPITVKDTISYDSVTVQNGTDNNGKPIFIQQSNGENLTHRCVAQINGDAEDALPTIENVKVDSVFYVRRGGAGNEWQTMILPFAFGECKETGIDFYEIKSIECDFTEWKWKLTTSNRINQTTANKDPVLANEILANKPYIVKFVKKINANDKIFTVGPNENCQNITINTSSEESTTIDDWTLRGTYSAITWDKDHEDLGRVYGFSGSTQGIKDTENYIKVGTFVKAGAGANIPPMRAYLYYSGYIKNSVAAKASPDALASIGVENLPDYIEVVAEDEDGTTVIATIKNPDIKMIQDNHWVDMKGRKFDGKPQNAGTYYNQGKKVIIK